MLVPFPAIKRTDFSNKFRGGWRLLPTLSGHDLLWAQQFRGSSCGPWQGRITGLLLIFWASLATLRDGNEEENVTTSRFGQGHFFSCKTCWASHLVLVFDSVILILGLDPENSTNWNKGLSIKVLSEALTAGNNSGTHSLDKIKLIIILPHMSFNVSHKEFVMLF